MKRITFRRTLPLIMFALSLALWLVGQAQLQAHLADREARFPGWTFWDSYQPLLLHWCIALNFPVFLATVLPIVFLEIYGFVEIENLLQNGEIVPGFLVIPAGVMVAVLWYAVGLWIDRRLGLAKTPPARKPAVVRRVLAWVGLVLCLGMAARFALVFLEGAGPNVALVGGLLWTVYGVLVLGMIIFRWHRHPNLPVGSVAVRANGASSQTRR